MHWIIINDESYDQRIFIGMDWLENICFNGPDLPCLVFDSEIEAKTFLRGAMAGAIYWKKEVLKVSKMVPLG